MAKVKVNISQAEIEEDYWNDYKARAKENGRSAKKQMMEDIKMISAKWRKTNKSDGAQTEEVNNG